MARLWRRRMLRWRDGRKAGSVWVREETEWQGTEGEKTKSYHWTCLKQAFILVYVRRSDTVAPPPDSGHLAGALLQTANALLMILLSMTSCLLIRLKLRLLFLRAGSECLLSSHHVSPALHNHTIIEGRDVSPPSRWTERDHLEEIRLMFQVLHQEHGRWRETWKWSFQLESDP